MQKLPRLSEIKSLAARIPKNSPIVIITPVNRYLGFSAPVPASQQLQELATAWGVPFQIRDPQRLIVRSSSKGVVEVCDEEGPLKGSVFFGFGHDFLDRSMVRYLIIALEKSGRKVINGEKALTYADDKGLMAIALANSQLPIPTSIITGTRATINQITSGLKVKEQGKKILIEKPTGFSAGGIGVRPIPLLREYILPAIWSSRGDSKPKVLQTDSENTPVEVPRKVIRAYVVGDNFIGAYITSAKGFVNCAGLSKEMFEAYPYTPSSAEQKAFIKIAKVLGTAGYCRIDAAGGKNFEIYEVNPLARIDAEKYNIDVKSHLLLHAMKRAAQK